MDSLITNCCDLRVGEMLLAAIYNGLFQYFIILLFIRIVDIL